MNVPTISQLKSDPMLQETWRICMKCQGGRGETVQVVQEIGGELSKVFKTITCRSCAGIRVVPKFPDQQ